MNPMEKKYEFHDSHRSACVMSEVILHLFIFESIFNLEFLGDIVPEKGLLSVVGILQLTLGVLDMFCELLQSVILECKDVVSKACQLFHEDIMVLSSTSEFSVIIQGVGYCQEFCEQEEVLPSLENGFFVEEWAGPEPSGHV
ncbi:unnamed protein product [Allacma fusca]|uniref:Uncharacterized protein n=1 Tax=Allacma fusca TaxID=39272 RepID=A0A8J2LHB5_9HEXA|nr:unnamed protein product [Allacma fusca]